MSVASASDSESKPSSGSAPPSLQGLHPVSGNKRLDIIQGQNQSNDDPDIYFRAYTNDGTDESNVALIALKNIFARQLPKMPKEYIVRLVFDKRHISIAIQKKTKIIGGICYRPYFDQRFGEIAFCAINSSEQVRGYGTKLMNQVKAYAQWDKIEYFVTYADNFAIGYFQKQGFSKQVTMPKDRWVGYIKDYDGGTLMECYIHPNINYLKVPEMVSQQRSYIVNRISERSKSDIEYAGIPNLGVGSKRLFSASEIPGVLESGWNSSSVSIARGSTERDRQAYQVKLQGQLKSSFDKIRASQHAWPFEAPVNPQECPEYFEVIHDPIDLTLIQHRLKQGDYYRSHEMYLRDLHLMIKNCKTFNNPSDEYFMAAVGLDKVITEIHKDVLETLGPLI